MPLLLPCVHVCIVHSSADAGSLAIIDVNRNYEDFIDDFSEATLMPIERRLLRNLLPPLFSSFFSKCLPSLPSLIIFATSSFETPKHSASSASSSPSFEMSIFPSSSARVCRYSRNCFAPRIFHFFEVSRCGGILSFVVGVCSTQSGHREVNVMRSVEMMDASSTGSCIHVDNDKAKGSRGSGSEYSACRSSLHVRCTMTNIPMFYLRPFRAVTCAVENTHYLHD